ncbi:hypothetical protein GW590_18105 [Rahnella sp. SAP-1]|uniref:Uncharacterized protein n=1 Tax=Rouxiella aceris TaxID=2703884 RepID=A0A848MNM1_9GAMM|nr:hypothetical protein [Rouxiella aceris]NMP28776.1 hypothetical protein [Rouxiella aceris]
MEKRKVLDEGRQLKRLNAETRKLSHVHKWFAIVAALDCVLVFFYDRDMRNIVFSGGVCLVCTYLWFKGRMRSRAYRREYREKYAKDPAPPPAAQESAGKDGKPVSQ